MKEPIKILLLPTEDTNLGAELKNTIYKHSENKSLVIGYLNARSTRHIPHHVYITVSQDVEPIREGDWYMFMDDSLKGQFEQAKRVESQIPFHNCSKIIATTDLKLKLKCFCSESEAIYCGSKCQKPILQLQQSFLEEFVDNPNGEFEVEYEAVYLSILKEKVLGYKLKLNQDNTVNITSVGDNSVKWNSYNKVVQSHRDGTIYVPVKEKMYSKEQVISLCRTAANDYVEVITDEDNWIEKNL